MNQEDDVIVRILNNLMNMKNSNWAKYIVQCTEYRPISLHKLISEPDQFFFDVLGELINFCKLINKVHSTH